MVFLQIPEQSNKFAEYDISGVGVGLRHRHFSNFIEDKPDIPWLEVHSENFFYPDSAASLVLREIRENYPLSAHCVGLSLGSYDPVSESHLNNLRNFIKIFEPSLVSDHLSWSASDNIHLPDLLPIPYTEEALEAICRNIDRTQEFLKRKILIENPSSYLSFNISHIPEWEFFVEATKRTGCGLLLDINNIHVSAHNHDFDAKKYIDYVPKELVEEIHLSGYKPLKLGNKEIYIDDHGAKVYDEVWELYEYALIKLGQIPTLIEWDTDIPGLNVLLAEKNKAEKIRNKLCG